MSDPLTGETARCWADIDLSALAANARAFRSMVGSPLLPVVKADGYGLGAPAVVRALEATEPWGYGVGTVEEGEEVRALGITRPVLVLTPMLPELGARHLAAGLRPTVGHFEALAAWLALGDAPFHLEIDTGMRRAGFTWNDADALAALGPRLSTAKGWEGAYCQFHSAEVDPAATRLQWARLQETLAALGRRPPLVHAANSGAGALGLAPGADLARPGFYLYGGRVGGHVPVDVVSLRARVVAVRRVLRDDSVSYGATWRADRPTQIATVAAGYADGVPFGIGNTGRVEIAGTPYPVAGRVTMDMTMVAVGDATVRPGAVATIWGGRISLEEQAQAAGTIPYTLLTGLGPRVVRRYRSE